jgi:hypothetical protein
MGSIHRLLVILTMTGLFRFSREGVEKDVIMSRIISKTIGLVCVAATALALSVSTQASTKHKHRKPTVNEPSGKSFRYNEFSSNSGFRGKNRRGTSGLNSFRYNAFRSDNINKNGVIGFPFRDSFGFGDNSSSANSEGFNQSGNNGNSVVINEGPREPLGLQITGTFFEKRPGAKVIHVSDELKDLGEERAERRRERLNSGHDNRVFRFYRSNEAYDVRFPSVVYLNSN